MSPHTRRSFLKLGAGVVTLSGISSVGGAKEIIKTEEFVIHPADSHQGSPSGTCATSGEWTKFADSARLPDGTTTYRINGFEDKFVEPINNSFETWAEVADIISFKRDSKSNNVVRFVSMGRPGPLGRAFVTWRKWPGPQRIIRFDIRINNDHKWDNLKSNPVCDGPPPGPNFIFNMQDTVTHEVGHAIGLSHAVSEESIGNTMAPFGYAQSTFASTLAEGDKNGARALYHET